MILRLSVFLAGVAWLATAGTIYTVNDTIGSGSVTGTIETDGAIGTLATADILDWNLVANYGSGSFDLEGPLSGANSGVLIYGAGVSGSATQLIFDWNGAASAMLFQAPSIGSGSDFWCLDASSNGGCVGNPASDTVGLDSGSEQVAERSGTEVIGTSSASTTVPEPSSLGLVLFGAAAVLFSRLHFRKLTARR
jgi:hypothetical protein